MRRRKYGRRKGRRSYGRRRFGRRVRKLNRTPGKVGFRL